MKGKQGVAVDSQINVHYLDHLGPISAIMEIPFMMTEEEHSLICKKYYPDVDCQLMSRAELSSEYLFHHFDVLFLSDYFSRELYEKHFASKEKEYDKKIRIVHGPHGFSDKSDYLKKYAFEDILLVYGQNLLDMLRECEVIEDLKNYVITGNYRYSYYKKHQSFYEEIMKNEILSKFEKEQPIILYAPTWNDSGQTTSFYDAALEILENLPSHYNMVVKLHPNLERDDILSVYQRVSEFEEKGNILFLSKFPLVYPLLACIDIYIGDMSAVGYDFLVFNKPMFFIKTPRIQKRVIYKCGIEVPLQEIKQIYEIIENNISNDEKQFSAIRQETYAYTFGQEKSFKSIKREVEEACER